MIDAPLRYLSVISCWIKDSSLQIFLCRSRSSSLIGEVVDYFEKRVYRLRRNCALSSGLDVLNLLRLQAQFSKRVIMLICEVNSVSWMIRKSLLSLRSL